MILDRSIGYRGRRLDSRVRHQWAGRLCLVAVLAYPWIVCMGAFAAGSVAGARAAPSCAGQSSDPGCVRDYRSHRLLLHTDLAPPEARALLGRLESLRRMMAAYWGRPLRDPIECYVVDDLAHWKPGMLANPSARTVLKRVGGGTDFRQPGKRADNHSRSPLKARVYAMSEPGIAEHELVHAYCFQTFGTCGPDWYKEGMAQMACYRVVGRRGVHCPADVVHFLRRSPALRVADVVDNRCFTAPIASSLARLTQGRASRPSGRPSLAADTWRAHDELALSRAKESYYQSWALCHLLCHHPGYKKQFRALGRALLTKQDVRFDRTFAADRRELAFEFRFFLEHCAKGYRVELCRWDWDHLFRQPDHGRGISARIVAARGYQASGALITRGHRYAYAATGAWKTAAEGPATAAGGDGNGRGRLVGIVFQGFGLSKPFNLGERGTFVAPSSGRLHLRCRDAWQSLGDNEGSVTVRVEGQAG